MANQKTSWGYITENLLKFQKTKKNLLNMIFLVANCQNMITLT